MCERVVWFREANVSARHVLRFFALDYLVMAGCGGAFDDSSLQTGQQGQNLTAKRVGILFSSYGDIDSPDEAEGYVKRSILDPDVAPIPSFLKPLVANLGWFFMQNSIKGEYRKIGGSTHYRESSTAQAELVAADLRDAGVNIKSYTGFVFTYPYIVGTMAQIQADGIEELVVFNQGAQFSKVTQGINIREVKKYLNQHPEWSARVIAVRSFSDDDRFRDLLAASVQRRLDSDFPGVQPEDVCIFFPVHGLPMYLPNSGDPAIPQMQRAVDEMRDRFPSHPVFIGFQNHAELGSNWTQPADLEVARQIGGLSCPNVVINGRVSFTVDNLETLFDQGVAQRDEILKVRPSARVVVEKMFQTEPSFAEYIKTLTLEALSSRGDLALLR